MSIRRRRSSNRTNTSRTWHPYSRADQMTPPSGRPGPRWRTSPPRLRTSCQAPTFVRNVAPMAWRAMVLASKLQSGHGRSSTQVQFLSSGSRMFHAHLLKQSGLCDSLCLVFILNGLVDHILRSRLCDIDFLLPCSKGCRTLPAQPLPKAG